MADENIVTNIVANANFSGLIADVNKVAASLSKLQAQIIQSDARLASQVATMNRSFGENLRRTGQFSTHFVTLTSDVEKFGTNLDKGQMKLKQYFQTFQQHTKTQGGLIRDLAKQQVALQNAIIQPMGKNAQGLMQYSVHIPQGLDAVKNKTALAKQELQIMNKVIQDGGVQMINWGKNTQWAGRQLTVGLTVPLAAFGKAAADAFRAADAELVRLTKVYGGVAATSAADLSKIRNEVSATAKDIAKAYGVSFKDTISLAADIAATGKQGNELLSSLKETSRLAVLGEVDRQDAMKATLAIQNTFKENTTQLADSINFLNAVENQTSTSLGDLITAIPKAGPVIQGMGGSVKDLALMLVAMKEGGIDATQGANALKSALASLINPTKVAKEKFSALGIDLGGIVTKNAGNLTGTILELQKALDNLDPLQKQQAIEQLFGKFQFARMNALFANLGKQGSQTLQVLDLMKASSQELAGVASRELGMVTESASGKYRRALEGLKADLASMGEGFLKVQTFFINVTDSIVKFVGHLPGPIKTILTFVTGLTAIIGPVIMLTGVLANFFGYIIKGASHFKSLFKGGEGWKMLTPEILAAQKAGSLVEATFYSDAKAATVLKTAIAGLVTEFELLQSKAMTGGVSAGPMLSTVAGNVVSPGGAGRVVDPNHPLISPEDTRSMSHLNPVAGMTLDQKAQQTIFGVVPGAPKVNQKIGNNPQMYMSGDLPKIPGLTSIGGASTGIVAEEAAKWHAMTGALAMQSQAEIELLKKEVATTGLITTSLSDSYQALLPTMTKLTANAATESAAIVAELQSGKITVDAARSKIIALNAQVESMMAQASIEIAGQQGRSIGLTTVPLLNQPVVNKDGKTNMKELLRPGRTRGLLNKIASGLGVRTFGAGYSTETTIPKRLNAGNIVPGTGNTDTVPAMLTPGEFVVNKEATAANLPLLHAINGGERSAGYGNILGGYMSPAAGNAVLKMFGVASRSTKNSRLVGNWGMILPNSINRRLRYGRATGAELLPHISDSKNLIDVERFLRFKNVDPSDIANVQSKIARQMKSGISPDQMYGDPELGALAFAAITPEIRALESKYPGISLAYQKDRMSPGRRDTQSSSSRHGPSPTGINIPGWRASSYGSGSGTGNNRNVWAHFGDQEFDQNVGMLAQGYAAGGIVGNILKGQAMKRIGAGYGPTGAPKPSMYESAPWAVNSLSIKMAESLFANSGLRKHTQKLFYDKFAAALAREKPYGYVKDAQGSLKNALEPDVLDSVIRSAASDMIGDRAVLSKLSPIDKDILKKKYLNWESKKDTPLTESLKKLIFGIEGREKGGPVSANTPYIVGEKGPELFVPRNAGGIIPRYAMGGMVRGYEDGGIISSAFQGAKQQGFVGQGAFNKARTGGLSSPMAGMGIGMAMQGAGAMIPGQAGTILQIASILPMISMAPITKLIAGITGIGSTLKTAGGAAKIFEMILKNAFRVGPILAVTLAVTGLVLLFKKWRSEVAENAKEQTMLNGLTEKGATQAGIKYNNLSDSIKGVKDQMDLFRASQLTAFNSTNSAGITGLTLTIKELQDKIKAAKSDMPEFVSSLNSLSKSSDDNKKATIAMAANWKAQFVAGGMSVAEATNQIYAIVKASDMANHAFAAISSTGFTSIKDQGTAVNYMFNALNKNMGKLSGSDLGNALSNVVVGIDSARQALVGTKDANGEIITQQKALQITMDKLNSSSEMNKTLTNDQVESLKKTHPELAKILNSTDTVKSTYAKWRIMLSGVNIDLKTISSTQAEALSKFIDLENAAISAAEKITDPKQAGYIASIAKSSSIIEKLNAKIKAGSVTAEKIAVKTKDQIDAEIKLIDKKIKKIQEEADARIKAIEKTQNAESYAIELKQAQLDLQSAIASGDKEAQVRAGIALAGLQKRHESEMAIASIQDDAAAKTKAEDEKKAKLQEQLDALSKKVLNAQAAAADVTVLRDKVAGYQSRREAILSRQVLNAEQLKANPTDKKALAEKQNISTDFSVLAGDAARDAAGKNKALAQAIKDAFTGTLIDEKGNSLGGKTIAGPGGSKNYVEGKGLDVLKADATQVTDRLDISNKLLSDIKAALGGGGGLEIKDMYTGKKNARYGSGMGPMSNLPGGKNKDLTDGAGDLTVEGIVAAIKDNSFKKNDRFTFNGRTYKVHEASAWQRATYQTQLYADVVSKALGGPFAAGQKLMVNDRINPLGGQQEGMLIRPNFSGTIYPNAATMPRYDVPSGGYSGYRNASASVSSGVAPVINNYITASPNMDIKQLAREVGMVTAKAVSRGGNNRGYSNGTQQVVNI
jgi:TP901 family phage tail tape measure protein